MAGRFPCSHCCRCCIAISRNTRRMMRWNRSPTGRRLACPRNWVDLPRPRSSDCCAVAPSCAGGRKCILRAFASRGLAGSRRAITPRSKFSATGSTARRCCAWPRRGRCLRGRQSRERRTRPWPPRRTAGACRAFALRITRACVCASMPSGRASGPTGRRDLGRWLVRCRPPLERPMGPRSISAARTNWQNCAPGLRARLVPMPSATPGSTIWCDGFWPLLAARGADGFFAWWFYWPTGDLPPQVTGALRALGVFTHHAKPACHGFAQGMLGWLLARENFTSRVGCGT